MLCGVRMDGQVSRAEVGQAGVLTALLWSGLEWQEEDLGAVRRQPDGWLSIFSREQQSFEVAYIDTDGRVNVASWSPRAEFRPAANQYESQSTVLIQAATGTAPGRVSTANGQYVGAVGGGGSGLIAEAAIIGPWELFYLAVLPGDFGKVTIRCINETHFWTAPGGGGGPLAADKSKPQTWETFLLGKVSA